MTQTVHILLMPAHSMMALASLIEPMRVANRFQPGCYEWKFLSIDGEPVSASNGVPFQVHNAIRDVKSAETIIVQASFDPLEHVTDELRGWLRYQARTGARLGSLDTGAWILADAGLLDGRVCTMHWESVPSFLETHDSIEISLNLFELSPNLITCAGGTAAIDMMLALIAEDHSTALAVRVAEQFIHSRIRARSAPQRMTTVEQLGISNRTLVAAVEIMDTNIEDPLDVPELARVLNVTRRQLERLFRGHLNDTPGNFYMKVRLTHAQRLLQQTDMPITEIAVACGFAATSHFSRAYSLRFGRPPTRDRRIFAPDLAGGFTSGATQMSTS